MANSPRPGVWSLEKSIDNGKTFTPWQYFADSSSDCYNFFGVKPTKKIETDDQVICSTDYSKVLPVEGGEVGRCEDDSTHKCVQPAVHHSQPNYIKMFKSKHFGHLHN